MFPTEQLKEEHAGIKLMLDILAKICDRLESGKQIEKENEIPYPMADGRIPSDDRSFEGDLPHRNIPDNRQEKGVRPLWPNPLKTPKRWSYIASSDID